MAHKMDSITNRGVSQALSSPPCRLTAARYCISKGDWGPGERLPEFQAASRAPTAAARRIVFITSTWQPEASSQSGETEVWDSNQFAGLCSRTSSPLFTHSLLILKSQRCRGEIIWLRTPANMDLLTL